MWHEWRGEVFRGEIFRQNYLGVLGVGGRIILKWMFKNEYGEGLTGLIWLRIGAVGGLF